MKNIPLKKVAKISIILYISGFALILIGCGIGAASLVAGLLVIIAGLLVLIGAIIFIILFYRCPHCGSFLRTRFYRTYCPFCGKYIE
ncbi:MAG: DUF2207 domain-containing protein [Lachnospiraceae bacterium]|nr:DUF2207 domain-containing protein [Lachnospiraceae bacterium]